MCRRAGNQPTAALAWSDRAGAAAAVLRLCVWTNICSERELVPTLPARTLRTELAVRSVCGAAPGITRARSQHRVWVQTLPILSTATRRCFGALGLPWQSSGTRSGL